jgi:hypothetical protein
LSQVEDGVCVICFCFVYFVSFDVLTHIQQTQKELQVISIAKENARNGGAYEGDQIATPSNAEVCSDGSIIPLPITFVYSFVAYISGSCWQWRCMLYVFNINT